MIFFGNISPAMLLLPVAVRGRPGAGRMPKHSPAALAVAGGCGRYRDERRVLEEGLERGMRSPDRGPRPS